jgi:hypothetical protein
MARIVRFHEYGDATVLKIENLASETLIVTKYWPSFRFLFRIAEPEQRYSRVHSSRH